MLRKKPLQNIILSDEVQIDRIFEQLPKSGAILERLKPSIGFSIKIATFEIPADSTKDLDLAKKIRRLENYLDRNGLINTTRPRRMPIL